MFDDSSPSVLSLNATHASKLEEAGIGEVPELALDGAEDAVELVPEDDGAEDVVVLDDAGGAGLGGAGGGCGSGNGVAWNPAGGIVRTCPTTSMYGEVRWFSSTMAYQGVPKRAPTDDALSPACTV